MTDVEAIDDTDDDTGLVSQESFSSTFENENPDRTKTSDSCLEYISCNVRKYIISIGHRIFGDKYGLVVFCGALAFFMLYWRIGVFINDNYTLANGLVAVSEGQLHVHRAVYGPSLNTPGMVDIDGLAYARNYGQLILAVPFLWVIQGAAAVADLRVALAGGWALLLLGLAILVGGLFDRDVYGRDCRTLGTYVGSVAALTVFALVIRGATPIDPVWHHLMALQLQSMVAAALVGVVMYRLVTRIHGREIGLAAGGVVVFATPLAFWSSFPKRHALVALGVVVSIYCLYRSREALSEGSARNTWQFDIASQSLAVSEMTRFRALAYVPVGFVAWVNPIEGLILLAALLAVDVPTGGRRIRSLIASGCACVLSVVPMFITNILITGNPLEPPTANDFYGSGGLAEQGGRGGAGGGGGGASGGADPGTASSTTFDSFVGVLTVAGEYMSEGISVVTSELDTVLYVFVRSGYVEGTIPGGDAWRLSFLEVMPLSAAFVLLPVILLQVDLRQRISGVVGARKLSAVDTVDAFVVVYFLIATVMFLPKFPMNAEITVRYLLVLFPLAVYGVARLSAVRRVVSEQYRTCLAVYLTGVLVGGQILFLFLYATHASLDESIQAHAYVGLGLALLVDGWILTDASGRQVDRVGAIVLGLAAAEGTVFILLARLWYFAYAGSLSLPLV